MNKSMTNTIYVKILVSAIIIFDSCTSKVQKPIIIDESASAESIEQVINIDKVWAGHPVGFCLLTHENRQYIAYYNAERSMVVGQRNLDEDVFSLHVMPRTSRELTGGTSTVLDWDSHNSVTL